MNTPKIALITGANKGIGRQIAAELIDHGFIVLIGARDPNKGQQTAEELGPEARAIQLDVTDSASIDTAKQKISQEYGRLDVLVNNAAIAHAGVGNRSLDELTQAAQPSLVSMDELKQVFETNAFGALAVTQAMLPLLRQAPAARIVMVSSGAGSLSAHADPNFAMRKHFGAVYGPSKTLLNAFTLALAIELEDSGIKVNAANPGPTATEFNNFFGNRTVKDGAAEAVRLALLDDDGPTGTFSGFTFSGENGPNPW
ncbi:dehydrogenase [Saccharospirillum sp. MSK14-1]|uniref:SDR family NAD(P)-dependent oxidoreductase n=1 Tax=Saccharospirillum sp. MSK14-1 TaxID=1897632 RepID=UPI000D38707F|nr:SDR family NAD(P)-dependent oxidoreductase [Saccharospirillum sp. MSK14-1]PTY36834.1 dehydrogenase [Saccharospirillum sp. MSK14-1]